jgi:predicted acyl esterase
MEAGASPLSPRQTRSIENVWIPMSDGVNLAARLWMPDDAEQHPVPALLEYIPYRKRDTTRLRDETLHPYLASHGYASIRVDIRGHGDSEGFRRTST